MLTVEDLNKTYRLRRAHGDVEAAVASVSFDVRPGELFTLLGPSGCGKTTTLRSIAGLERPDSGRIVVNGTVMYDGEVFDGRVAVKPFSTRGVAYRNWPFRLYRHGLAGKAALKTVVEPPTAPP